MEEHGNKVSNLLANQSQNIGKFTSETNQNEPLGLWGGAIGANPAEPSRGRIRPPPERHGLYDLSAARSWTRSPLLGVGPEAHGLYDLPY